MINVFFILISILFMNVLSFNCGFKHINQTFHKVSFPESKRKLSSVYTPIKIKMDYTYMESQGKDNLTSKVKNVLDKTISIFESLLSVNHDNFPFLINYPLLHCGINNYDKNINPLLIHIFWLLLLISVMLDKNL